MQHTSPDIRRLDIRRHHIFPLKINDIQINFPHYGFAEPPKCTDARLVYPYSIG